MILEVGFSSKDGIFFSHVSGYGSSHYSKQDNVLNLSFSVSSAFSVFMFLKT